MRRPPGCAKERAGVGEGEDAAHEQVMVQRFPKGAADGRGCCSCQGEGRGDGEGDRLLPRSADDDGRGRGGQGAAPKKEGEEEEAGDAFHMVITLADRRG